MAVSPATTAAAPPLASSPPALPPQSTRRIYVPPNRRLIPSTGSLAPPSIHHQTSSASLLDRESITSPAPATPVSRPPPSRELYVLPNRRPNSSTPAPATPVSPPPPPSRELYVPPNRRPKSSTPAPATPVSPPPPPSRELYVPPNRRASLPIRHLASPESIASNAPASPVSPPPSIHHLASPESIASPVSPPESVASRVSPPPSAKNSSSTCESVASPALAPISRKQFYIPPNRRLNPSTSTSICHQYSSSALPCCESVGSPAPASLRPCHFETACTTLEPVSFCTGRTSAGEGTSCYRTSAECTISYQILDKLSASASDSTLAQSTSSYQILDKLSDTSTTLSADTLVNRDCAIQCSTFGILDLVPVCTERTAPTVDRGCGKRTLSFLGDDPGKKPRYEFPPVPLLENSDSGYDSELEFYAGPAFLSAAPPASALPIPCFVRTPWELSLFSSS